MAWLPFQKDRKEKFSSSRHFYKKTSNLGQGVLDHFVTDGFNHNGDDNDKKFNLIPYEDKTDYEPVNPSKKLVDPTKWQPLVAQVKGN